jgi:[protein-PII] uridylyltransferase
LKTRLRDGQRLIRERFLAGNGDAVRLLHERCQLVDEVLCELWSELALPASLALIAVGGYGRGELYPASDVDLLILLPEQADEVLTTRPRTTDLRILGHRAGNRPQRAHHRAVPGGGCRRHHGADGDDRSAPAGGQCQPVQGFIADLGAVWTHCAFFQSKRMEQEDRHQRFSDTPYSLEANCKEGPGGLRDLQLILWIAQAAATASAGKISNEAASSPTRRSSFSLPARPSSAACARTCTCTPDAAKIACSSSTRRPGRTTRASPPAPTFARASN